MRLILALLLLSSPTLAEEFIVTGYCNEGKAGCKICNGKWAKYNKTKSGASPKAGTTCAAPRNIPFGTVVHIEGIGKRIVQDRLHPSFEGRFEVFFSTHKEAKDFGIRKLHVSIISSHSRVCN